MWGSVWSGPRPLAGWPEGTSRLVAREETRTRATRKMVSLLKCQTWCNHLERTFYKIIKVVALLIVKMHLEVVVLQRAGFCWIVKASDCEEIWEKKLWGGFLNDWRFSVFCCKDWSPRFSQVLLFLHKLSRRTLSPLHWNLFTFTMKPPICIKLLSPSSLFDKYLDITSMAVYINIPVVLVATWANTFNFMTCSAVNLWWHKKLSNVWSTNLRASSLIILTWLQCHFPNDHVWHMDPILWSMGVRWFLSSMDNPGPSKSLESEQMDLFPVKTLESSLCSALLLKSFDQDLKRIQYSFHCSVKVFLQCLYQNDTEMKENWVLAIKERQEWTGSSGQY